MKILLCFGTRPEAIKMASLYHELLKHSVFNVQVCVTAQHRQMLDQVLDFFQIVPDYDLDLMQHNQTLNSLSANILFKIDTVLKEGSPDLVMVHGDTTTSTMVALAAFHKNIKVGHVEAGLRTYNKYSPYPEEINRQITTRIANYHFAPTQLSKNNLLSEGVLEKDILITGNTVIDSLLWTKRKLESGFENQQINDLKNLAEKKFILVTGHRRESFGQGLIDFCEALIEIATDDIHIVFPVHLNPNVHEIVYKMLGQNKNIHLLKPIDYPVMIWLMSKCIFVISDSGGIQEEAPTFKKHILVTREVSERPEGLENGFSTLVGTNKKLIVEKAKYFIENKFDPINNNPYGNGTASRQIIDYLLNQI